MDAPARRASDALLSFAAFVVVIAGIRAAATLATPFLLAVFVAIVCAPALLWLESRRVPMPLAIVLVMAVVLAAFAAFGTLVGTSIADFTRAIPTYDERLQRVVEDWAARLAPFGVDVRPERIREIANPTEAMRLVGNLLSGLGNLLANGFLILLTAVFMLLEAASFPVKLAAISGDPAGTRDRVRHILDTVKRYLAIKTATSLATGGAIAGALAVMGVRFALLWGVLAFLFNYVPTIGSIIAAIPAVLIALVQLGPGWALGVTAIYLVVNITIGSFVEPRVMGRGLGLSPLVVLASLVFWGWVLGPVGMLLSVPLTMTAKIALEADEDTRWVGVLLGPAIEARHAVQAVEARAPEADEDRPAAA